MKSVLLSRRDLDFLLFEWLRVDELTKRERFAEHSRETFDGVLDLCEQLAGRYFAQHNKTSDANEPTFDGEKVTIIPEVKEAWDAFVQADLIPMSMDQQLGGAQLPVTVAQAGFAWFSAANVSTTGYLMLTMANANLLARFGSPELIDAFLQPMLTGRFSGTMALSETQAGSSLADILTRAEPQDDGTYRLFGSKMWISGAEHALDFDDNHDPGRVHAYAVILPAALAAAEARGGVSGRGRLSLRRCWRGGGHARRAHQAVSLSPLLPASSEARAERLIARLKMQIGIQTDRRLPATVAPR